MAELLLLDPAKACKYVPSAGDCFFNMRLDTTKDQICDSIERNEIALRFFIKETYACFYRSGISTHGPGSTLSQQVWHVISSNGKRDYAPKRIIRRKDTIQADDIFACFLLDPRFRSVVLKRASLVDTLVRQCTQYYVNRQGFSADPLNRKTEWNTILNVLCDQLSRFPTNDRCVIDLHTILSDGINELGHMFNHRKNFKTARYFCSDIPGSSWNCYHANYKDDGDVKVIKTYYSGVAPLIAEQAFYEKPSLLRVVVAKDANGKLQVEVFDKLDYISAVDNSTLYKGSPKFNVELLNKLEANTLGERWKAPNSHLQSPASGTTLTLDQIYEIVKL